jgi:hypothetical protein
MKNLILVAALTAGVSEAWADEQKETLKEQSGKGKVPPIEVRKDPRQTILEPTTQIRPNTPAGAAASSQKGSGNAVTDQQQPTTIDKDLQNRVLVALSTGSTGTQGILATNQLTNIKVDVKDRVVTLRGDVTTEKNRQVLEKRVKGLAGVDRVVNQLTVNPSGQTRRDGLQNPDGYSGNANPIPR